MKPSFQTLWNNYPKKMAPCVGGWENQCALRLGIALKKSGLTFLKYEDPTCTHGNPRGAESLANYLWKTIGPCYKYTDSAKKKIGKKKGIILFKDISGFRGGNGDHIDLWNGHQTKTGSYFKFCKEVWFWSL